LGNFLNAGNNRLGEAYGFNLETLAKLYDTKTSDNKQTVFDVIVEMIKDQKPDVLVYSKTELDLIDEGARVSLQTLEADINKLRKEFTEVQQLAPTVTPVEDDLFQERFKAFETKAVVELEAMEKDFKDASKKYEEVVLLFAEDPKAVGPEEFFLHWKTLCSKIVETSTKIDVERDKAEKLRKREEAKKARETPAAGRGAGRGRGPAGRGEGATAEGAAGEGAAEGATAEGEAGEGASAEGGEGAGRGRGRGRGRAMFGGAPGRGGGPGRGDGDMVNELFAKMQTGNVYKDRREND